jgi:hypothetical protein
MKEIIAPVPVEELMAELTADKFVRTTNYGNNQIYCFTHHHSPALMREIGRLREIAFRQAGGGTGKELDLDPYDLEEEPYHQLIVWDPKHRVLMGGYRYKELRKARRDEKGNSLELGRSFVHPEYQASAVGRKSLFALDNLWDGIGALIVDKPQVKYLFGKVTMYKHYKVAARDALLYFMQRYCADHDKMLFPKTPLPFETDVAPLNEYFRGTDYLENYKLMVKKVRELGENVPPLINAYLNISPTLRSFGTTLNMGFGGVEETGILVTVADIYESKKQRHVATYRPDEAQPPLISED